MTSDRLVYGLRGNWLFIYIIKHVQKVNQRALAGQWESQWVSQLHVLLYYRVDALLAFQTPVYLTPQTCRSSSLLSSACSFPCPFPYNFPHAPVYLSHFNCYEGDRTCGSSTLYIAIVDNAQWRQIGFYGLHGNWLFIYIIKQVQIANQWALASQLVSQWVGQSHVLLYNRLDALLAFRLPPIY